MHDAHQGDINPLVILQDICTSFSTAPYRAINLINDSNNFSKLLEMVVELRRNHAIPQLHTNLLKVVSNNLIGFRGFELMGPTQQTQQYAWAQQMQQAQQAYVWALISGFYLTAMLFPHNCNDHDAKCTLDLYGLRIAKLNLDSNQSAYLNQVRLAVQYEHELALASAHSNCGHNHSHGGHGHSHGGHSHDSKKYSNSKF